MESVPDFLGDAKIHAFVDGSEIRGQAGFGVYFPHGEFLNVSQPVVGAQTNNRAEVSAVRAAIQRVPEFLCLYSDSKWCVDIFSNLCMYKCRGWMAQGKKPVRHHDIWEQIYRLYQGRTAPISVTQVYGHDRLVYNEEADALAKAGAALSKVHRPRRVRDMPKGRPEATRRKQTRGREIKRQAVVRRQHRKRKASTHTA